MTKQKSTKRILSLWIALALTIGGLATGMPPTMTVYAAETGTPDIVFAGSGTNEDPYQITSADELAGMAQLVNEANPTYNEAHYQLMNDIDLSAYGEGSAFNGGNGWIPIGHEDVGAKFFKGVFNGNRKTISGLYINNSVYDNTGLFGFLLSGRIENLGIVDADVSGKDADEYRYIGGLVGGSSGRIKNCYVTGSVSGNRAVGGITGCSNGNLLNCYSTATVSGYRYVGGLVGSSESGQILNCYASGTVICKDHVAGGIVGILTNYCIVEKCYSTADVSGNLYVGGIAGRIYESSVIGCYATGAVVGSEGVGGIAGVMNSDSKVENCVALNPSVNSGTEAGRVIGLISLGAANGNWALSTMTDPGAAKFGTIEDNATDKNGKNLSSAQTLTAAFWTTADNWFGSYWASGWDTTIWSINDGELPKLSFETLETEVDADKPAIGTQPIGAEIAADADHTFSVAATVTDGGVLSYQWFAVGATDDVMIEGATESSYTVSGANLGMGSHSYYVVITNTNENATGNKTATAKSDSATVTVLVDAAKPTITTQPAGGQIMITGSHTFTVIAESPDNGELSYQWFAADGTEIIGATESSYTVSGSNLDMGDYSYYVVITNTNSLANGEQTAFTKSDNATVTVMKNAQGAIISKQPSGGDIALNENIILSVEAESADGGELSYQWFNGDGKAIAGATESEYMVSGNLGAGEYSFYVEVTNYNENANGEKSVTVQSDTATVSVSDHYVTEMNGQKITFVVVGGIAELRLSDAQIKEMIKSSGSEIVFDFRSFSNVVGVDCYVSAGCFKGVDKNMTFKTLSGSYSLKTKSLWNNSGKTRFIEVREDISFKNI